MEYGALPMGSSTGWTYYGFGGGFTYEYSPKLSLGLDVTFMFSGGSSTKMHADCLGGMTFDLGDVSGTEIKAPFRFTLRPNCFFDLTPYFTWWEISKSEELDIGGGWVAYEPDSETHIEGVLAGFTYAF